MFELIGRIAVPGIDRTIKDIDSAADSTENMAFHTGKAQRAVKTFGETLGRTGDPLEALKNSADSLTHTFAKGLGATVVIAGAKLIIDRMKSLGEEVSKAAEASEKGLQKIAQAGDFKSAVVNTRALNEEMSKLRDRADTIDKITTLYGHLNTRLVGVTDTMRNLADATQGAADKELLYQAMRDRTQAQQIKNYGEEEKAIHDLANAREAELKSTTAISDETTRVLVENILKEKYAAEDARKVYLAGLKEQQAEAKNAADAQTERAKQDLKEYEAVSSGKLAAQKILFDLEAKQQDRKAKALQDEIENQLKLSKLYEDRAKQMEALVAAQEALAKKQGELATASIGLGGTMRGEGQQPTSYELGVASQAKQAAQKASLEDAQKYRQQIQDQLISEKVKQLQDKGYAIPSLQTKAEKNAFVSPEAVQLKQKELAVEAARLAAIEKGTKSLPIYQQAVENAASAVKRTDNSIKKLGETSQSTSAMFDGKSYSLTPRAESLSDSFLGAKDSSIDMVGSFLGATQSSDDLGKSFQTTNDATTDLTDSTNTASDALQEFASKAIPAAPETSNSKNTTTLQDIYRLLKDNLDELKTYAIAS